MRNRSGSRIFLWGPLIFERPTVSLTVYHHSWLLSWVPVFYPFRHPAHDSKSSNFGGASIVGDLAECFVDVKVEDVSGP